MGTIFWETSNSEELIQGQITKIFLDKKLTSYQAKSQHLFKILKRYERSITDSIY